MEYIYKNYNILEIQKAEDKLREKIIIGLRMEKGIYLENEMIENFEINTLEKFQNLSSLITCREKQNIKLIVEKLEIKDESDLLEIIDVIRYTKLNLLEFFLNKDFVNSVYDLKKIENIFSEIKNEIDKVKQEAANLMQEEDKKTK